MQYIDPSEKMKITLREFGDCEGSTCRLIEDDRLTYTTDYTVITLRRGDKTVTEHYDVG